MNRPAAAAAALMQTWFSLGGFTDARGQGLSVELSAGSVVYEQVSANVGTANMMGTLRYDGVRDAWVYGTAAAPLRSGDPAWASFGAGGRFLPAGAADRRVNVGLDTSVHGFMFRDAVVEQTGRGATIDAIPFVGIAAGAGSVELRGGWRGQTLAFGGATERRGVWEAGTRASYGTAVRAQADVRLVRAQEGTYPFVGATFVHSGARAQTWAHVGRGLSDDVPDVAWNAGVGVALGRQSTLWASLRQEAPDPLYWNSARRSWSVGVTTRLGRAAAAPRTAPRADSGGVVIQLPVADVPGTQLSIAGDFNNWQPVPMTREDGQWVIRLALAPGVYHYAFRAGNGDWFVPASVAGRRDDGMGGHVAVLVVS